MKLKRLLAVAVTTTMVLGSSMVAFADGVGTTEINNSGTSDKGVYTAQTTTTTNFEAPIIKVVVPNQTPVILNPYGINTEIAAIANVSAGVEDQTGEVVSDTYKITSSSNVALKVTAAITATASGATLIEDGVQTADATKAKYETAKWVWLKVTLASGDDTKTWDLAHKFTGKDTDVQPTVNIAAASFQEDGKTVNTPTEATITFTGDLNDINNVTTAWASSDSVKIVTKYTFLPVKLD